jgi:hypothetical protein
MTKLRNSAVTVATAVVITAMSIFVCAQAVTEAKPTVASKSANIELSIVVPREHIPMGQKPYVHLTIKNPSAAIACLKDKACFGLLDPLYRIYVEGPKGEPPTTALQRQLTGRPVLGDPVLRVDRYGVFIDPGKSITKEYDLSRYYDFKDPGNYTVYIDVEGESAPENGTGAGRWVRSPVGALSGGNVRTGAIDSITLSTR